MKNKTLDLNNPADAREFLNEAMPAAMKVAGTGDITEIVLASGRKLKFEDMSDSECVQYAFELLPIYQAAFPDNVDIKYEQ